MLKRIVREPLFHFLLAALAIFAIYSVFDWTDARRPDRIVVTAPKIEQMSAIFAKTWQRAPTEAELKGLIDSYVTEEIYYREALTLGLDKDDTIIRRRLRQKMEFLSDAAVDALSPTDADLETYLKTHPAAFEVEPMLAVQQVFLNPEQRDDKIDQDAASILRILLTSPETDPSLLGDATLLPATLPLTRKTAVAETFGPALAEALVKAIPGQWTGPVASDFGLHLIRVLERRPGRMPALTEVRDAVTRDWSHAKRKELEDHRLEVLLQRYQVTIESSSVSGAAQ